MSKHSELDIKIINTIKDFELDPNSEVYPMAHTAYNLGYNDCIIKDTNKEQIADVLKVLLEILKTRIVAIVDLDESSIPIYAKTNAPKKVIEEAILDIHKNPNPTFTKLKERIRLEGFIFYEYDMDSETYLSSIRW